MPDGTNDPRPPRPQLMMHVEGAREEELSRGAAAAEAVLYRDGDIDLVAAMSANARRDFITTGTVIPLMTSAMKTTGLLHCGRMRWRRRDGARRSK